MPTQTTGPPRFEGIKLESNIWTISGPPDSGKSNLAKFLLRRPQYRSHLVYDPLFGFDPDALNVMRPPRESFDFAEYEKGNPELNKGVRKYILGVDPETRPDYFVVDEAGALLPLNKPMGNSMGHISMFNAHMGISLGLIFQRFAEVNSNLKNKATHHFVMGYKGQNDRQALKDLHADLPRALDMAKEDYGQYGFVYTGPNNALAIMAPVPEVGKKSMM